MADAPGWLRGFQRSRIPNIATPFDRLSLFNAVNETAEEIDSAPNNARMPSHQVFGRLATKSLSSQSQPRLNQVDQIWHNPVPDQMAETLKVAMMTQNSFDPLHVPYNSCILHVLEAYHQMRKELIEKDRKIRDQEQRHESDAKDFRQLQVQWKGKEDKYKSEIKKLEVVLATGARGLELVTLARSRSALNGATRFGTTESQQSEKESEVWSAESDEELMMSNFAERKDSFVSTSYTSQRRMLNTRCNRGALTHRETQRSETPIEKGQPNGSTTYENKNSNARSDTTYSAQLHHMARSETSSNYLSGLEQEAECCTERDVSPPSCDLTYDEQRQKTKDASKPLPQLSIGLDDTSVEDSAEEENGEARLDYGENPFQESAIHNRGFSFIPGDDYGNLTLGNARTQSTVLALDDYGNRRRLSRSYLSLSNNFIDPTAPKMAKKQGRIRRVLGEGGATNTVREGKVNNECECGLTRSDSQNSIVTTVPDQSAAGNRYVAHVRDAPGRPKPGRLSGSSQATIAAVRAIADSGKIASRAR